MTKTTFLFILLGVLLVMSAFFSSTETALMRLSPYRVRALARKGNLGARLAEKLLLRPDRLIGLILAGNNAVNVAASAITTIIALEMGGEEAVAVGAGLLLLAVLIFAEVAPKTLAALYPERIALPAAIIYYPMLFVFYPIVWLVNALANGLLRLIGVSTDVAGHQALDRDALHAAVSASGQLLPGGRHRMLLRILDLEKVTVEDIMVPRADIVGIDLEDDWPDILNQLHNSQHTQLLAFRDSLDNIAGVLHLRSIIGVVNRGVLDRDHLVGLLNPAYFVPEDTPLNKQLLNFQSAKQRVALVVDEYGDLQGLVTLNDLLEEIVGEFTSDPLPANETVQPQDDGSFVVNGNANVRALNRAMHWHLPVGKAKTINGLLLNAMQTIPQTGTQVQIAGYPITVLRTADNAVQTVRIGERLKPTTDVRTNR